MGASLKQAVPIQPIGSFRSFPPPSRLTRPPSTLTDPSLRTSTRVSRLQWRDISSYEERGSSRTQSPLSDYSPLPQVDFPTRPTTVDPSERPSIFSQSSVRQTVTALVDTQSAKMVGKSAHSECRIHRMNPRLWLVVVVGPVGDLETGLSSVVAEADWLLDLRAEEVDECVMKLIQRRVCLTSLAL